MAKFKTVAKLTHARYGTNNHPATGLTRQNDTAADNSPRSHVSSNGKSRASGAACGITEKQRKGCESQCQGTFCLDRNLFWATPLTRTIEGVCMDITFACEFCGQHIVIDEAGAGMTVSCPTCSCELVVPTAVALAGQLQPTKFPANSSPPELATEKQKVYLRDLGVPFTESLLTKEQASTLIERTLANRPPSQRQKDKLRRLGLLDDLDEDATALEASQLLTEALYEQPTDTQLARAKEIGLRLTKINDLTAGELDDILKLEDRQPDNDTLIALKAYGFTDFSGTAYGAQMLLELAGQYNTDFEWDLSKNEIGRACLAAIRDPSYYKPTLRDGSFKWPKAKMREWSSGR